jgi:hypothetical protein
MRHLSNSNIIRAPNHWLALTMDEKKIPFLAIWSVIPWLQEHRLLARRAVCQKADYQSKGKEYVYMLSVMMLMITITYQISDSWESNSSSASLEIPRILWNSRIIAMFTGACNLSVTSTINPCVLSLLSRSRWELRCCGLLRSEEWYFGDWTDMVSRNFA